MPQFETDEDIKKFLRSCIEECGEFHEEAMQQVLDSVEHVVNNRILGDLVEVGVYKGVMVMAMCAKLVQLGVTDRHVHLYDTFQGMTIPSDKDVLLANGAAADMNDPSVVSSASLDLVKRNVEKIGYPMNFVHFHVSDVCKVEPSTIPSPISFLRLDTDWYESTKFELEHFTPRVSHHGVITQDDYAWWGGATTAVNEYLQGHHIVNYVCMKPHGIWWFHLRND